MTVYSRSGLEVLTTQLGHELLMLNVPQSQYHNLNDVGGRVWQLLEHPISAAALVDTLLEEYDIERARCEEDVTAFLDMLAARGLIVVSPGTSPTDTQT